MLGYITLGTNDLERAVAFYDDLLAVVQVQQLWRHGTMAAWGRSRGEPALCVASPWNGQRASVGNGVMVALKMAHRADVDAVHAKALALGGADEGAPGLRGEHGFYGGYFRDLDGNKLNAYVPAGG